MPSIQNADACLPVYTDNILDIITYSNVPEDMYLGMHNHWPRASGPHANVY